MGLPKVSVVQYLNSVPLVWGMLKGEQQGRYDLQFTTPAACADAVHQGKAEIGIVPSIEYQRIERAQILSGISIAAKDEVRSVLLLSKIPIEKVKSVAIDNSSRTSAALLRIMMRKFYSRFITVTPSLPKPAEMLKRADAALVIGDPALMFDEPVFRVYDLGAEWKNYTGLPFVFALWVGREDAKPARFRKDFEASRDYGLAHVDEIAAEYAPKLQLSAETIKVYLTQNVDYSLDEENRKGLRLFYKLAREAGIIPAEKELNFV
jgi:chorismate dehydratase